MHQATHGADRARNAWVALRSHTSADAVTLLSILVLVRLVLPSQFVVGALGGAGAPATILGLLLLAYWAWQRIHRVTTQPGAAINGVVFLFALVVLASDAVAAARPIDGVELNLSTLSLINLAAWIGGLLLASDGVSSPQRLRAIVTRVAVLGSAFAAFGLVQFVTGTAWVDRISLPGLVTNTPVYAITEREGFNRPFSTAIHPIEFGSVVAMVLPLTIVVGLLGTGRGLARWRSWIPALITVFAGSLSSSRSTLIGLGVGMLLLWPALKTAHRILGAVLGAGLAVFVFVSVPGMVSTVSQLFVGVAEGDSSVASRVDSFAVAGEYFARSPWLGRGFGTFLPRYRIFDNQYLLGLVETGGLGVLSMLLLWLVPAFGIQRVLRHTERGTERRLLGAGLLAGCVVGGIGLAFFDGFGFPMMPAIWFVLLGLGGAYVRLADETSSYSLPIQSSFEDHRPTA